MVQYRNHRGSYEDSMSEIFEFATKNELFLYIKKDLAQFKRSVDEENISIEQYVYDDRNGWDTFIVTLKDFGVLGYTDGPLE